MFRERAPGETSRGGPSHRVTTANENRSSPRSKAPRQSTLPEKSKPGGSFPRIGTDDHLIAFFRSVPCTIYLSAISSCLLFADFDVGLHAPGTESFPSFL